ENVLDVFEAVGDQIPLDRLLDIYLDAMEPREPRATIIARRVLARLESGDDAPGTRPGRPSRRREGKSVQSPNAPTRCPAVAKSPGCQVSRVSPRTCARPRTRRAAGPRSAPAPRAPAPR